MEVKGKGTMQTYILRVGRELDNQSDNADDDDNSFITCSSSLVKFFNPMFVGDKDDESVGLSDGNDLSRGRLTRVQSGLDTYEDVLPVKDTVFKGHTKWFGMTFRKGHIERAFLDGQARLHKNAVYYGYMLYVLGPCASVSAFV